MANAVPHTLFQWSLSRLQPIILFLSFMGTLLSYYTFVFRSTLLSSPCVGPVQFLHKRAYIHRSYSVSRLSWCQRQSLALFWLSSCLLVLRLTVSSPTPSTVPVTYMSDDITLRYISSCVNSIQECPEGSVLDYIYFHYFHYSGLLFSSQLNECSRTTIQTKSDSNEIAQKMDMISQRIVITNGRLGEEGGEKNACKYTGEVIMSSECPNDGILSTTVSSVHKQQYDLQRAAIKSPTSSSY